MDDLISHENKTVLMTIQNKKNPDQVIQFVLNPFNGHFETEGLQKYFGLKEIRVESEDVLGAMQEYAEVLSFVLETMSAAKDFNLPYYYQNEFQFRGDRYSLLEEGDYRVLKRVGA